MYLWRPWLLPILYHAFKGARDLYQRSAALVAQTSPSLYRQEGELIGGIEQCDGLHDKSIRRECKKLWKGILSHRRTEICSQSCYAGLPQLFVCAMRCQIAGGQKQRLKMYFGNASTRTLCCLVLARSRCSTDCTTPNDPSLDCWHWIADDLKGHC